MKLNYDKKSKDPTYFIQKGYRVGTKVTTKNVFRIGKHSELLKKTEDPLEYAKKIVAEYNEKEKNNNRITMEVSIDFSERLKLTDDLVSKSLRKNIGYFYLQAVYQKLGIREFLKKACEKKKITYDPDEVMRFLTFARILEPDSKLGTYDHFDRFYEEPSFGYEHILRMMDILAENYDGYLTSLYKNSLSIVKRNTSVCYYDCTNYYFETESQDPDYVDPITKEIIRGFRKYGPSKEHRPNPLVEMGLFMDADGIPISMCVVPGSDSEQTTAIPLEEKLIKALGRSKLIYVADAGLGSLNIRNFNTIGGRAFIVTQSIKKLSDTLKEAVFNDCDYRLLSSDKRASVEDMKSFDREKEENRAFYDDCVYKIIEADHAFDLGLYETVVLKNGKTAKKKSKAVLQQKLIVTFSRKMMEYQRFIRNRQIERAKEMLSNLDPETYKKGPNDVTRFIKRANKDSADRYELDLERIEEEAKYDGYYAVATNLDDPAGDILKISSQRYKIEDCFRVMKTNFSARPVYHHKKERIISHFLICYTALLIYRLLEKQLDDRKMHFTTENIIETLKNMEVTNLEDMCYASLYQRSKVSDALEEIYKLDLDRKYYQPKELSKKIRALKK